MKKFFLGFFFSMFFISLKGVKNSSVCCIYEAAIRGDINDIEQYLKKNPNNLDLRNRYGDTALALAVVSKQPDAVCLLVEKGANVLFRRNDKSLFGRAVDPETRTVLEAGMKSHWEKRVIKNPSMLEGVECSICLDLVTKEDYGVLTECGHQFHYKNCFENVAKECPLCRLKKPLIIHREELYEKLENHKQWNQRRKKCGKRTGRKKTNKKLKDYYLKNTESAQDANDEWLPNRDNS